MVDLTFPCPHAEVLDQTEKLLEKYNVPLISPVGGDVSVKPVAKEKSRIRMIIIDSIASNPGYVVPLRTFVPSSCLLSIGEVVRPDRKEESHIIFC